MHIHLASGKPFAMAGLYEFWKAPNTPPEAGWVTSCTIITTGANALLSNVHDRMPVFLTDGTEAAWLDSTAGEAQLTGLLTAYPGDLMAMHEVSSRVNSHRNDDPLLLARVNP